LTLAVPLGRVTVNAVSIPARWLGGFFALVVITSQGGILMSRMFTPARIGSLEVHNRIVRSATVESLADGAGFVTPELLRLYEELAPGRIGLIITGSAYVRRDGQTRRNQTGGSDDAYIPGLRKLARAVHRFGSKIAAQISHGGSQSRQSLTGVAPMAPSAVYNAYEGQMPREMTVGEIQDVVEAYVQAARRIREAGFDAVQLHGAHGVLLAQFLSPRTNLRTDHYGGSTQNRVRVVQEILRRHREVNGDFPILIKMNCRDFVPGGLEAYEAVEIARILSESGMDAIELSGGAAEVAAKEMARANVDSREKEAYFLPYAGPIKEQIAIPLILVGGLKSPDVIERILEEGKVDLAAMCRPFIREPLLVKRWYEGDLRSAECTSCNLCLKRFEEGVRCFQLEIEAQSARLS